MSLKSGTRVLHIAALHCIKVLDDNGIMPSKVRSQLDVFEHDEVMEVIRGSLPHKSPLLIEWCCNEGPQVTAQWRRLELGQAVP